MRGTVEIVLKLAQIISQDDKNLGFTLSKAFFKITGIFLWPNKNYYRNRIQYYFLNIIYPLFYTLNMLIFIFGLLNFVGKVKFEDPNGWSDFSIGLVIFMTLSWSLFKLFYLKINKNDFKNLIDLVESLGPYKNKEYINSALVWCIFFCGLCFSDFLAWLCYNVFFNKADYPVAVDFDVPTTITVWLVVNIMEVAGGFYCVVGHLAIDSLVPITSGVICAHLEELKARLRLVGRHGPVDAFTSGKIQNFDWATVVSSIQLHIQLLRCIKVLNNCCNFLLNLQVLYTIAHSCVIAFATIKVTDYGALTVNLLPLLLASYVQLFLQCYFGQKITTLFDELRFSLYDNDWVTSSLKVKKALALMAVCAKEEVFVGGYGFYKATHHTFLESCKESVSYFLFLRTVTGDGRGRLNRH